MAFLLDGEVQVDCNAVSDEDERRDVNSGQPEQENVHYPVWGVKPRHEDPAKAFTKMGIKPRDLTQKDKKLSLEAQPSNNNVQNAAMSKKIVLHTNDITDDMIEDGAYVVFDWDNTLKLYNRESRGLSSRVSHEFLHHLKHDRGCHLYIISAIRPSAINLKTILIEVDRLGLSDIFTSDNFGIDNVDGPSVDETFVPNQYARKGNIIICGYNKPAMFLELSSFDSAKGDKVIFFDDEEVNIDSFSACVPNSICYHCQ